MTDWPREACGIGATAGKSLKGRLFAEVAGGAVSRMATCLRLAHSASTAITSGDKRLPLGQCDRAAGFECLAIDEMALLAEMVVDVGVDRGELLCDFIFLKRSIARSRRRNGKCAFSGFMAQTPQTASAAVVSALIEFPGCLMSQHFLLSSGARTLSLAAVFALTDAQAELTFRKLRWADTEGVPVCPACGSPDAYDCRRASGTPRFRCRGCQKDFSVTSGTIFASLKRPLRLYLAAIVIFCNEHKGKSMLAMSRDLGLSYKTAFVLCHKIREAIGLGMRGRHMGGDGKTVEIDGAYFGGYLKPANIRKKRINRRLTLNLNGKRKAVVIIRERGGDSLPAVFKTEARAARFLMTRIRRGTIVQADDASAWDPLHSMFKVKRINHQKAYSLDGACTNGAEGYFSRLRRTEAVHGHISDPYLLRYAQEAAFREDRRRTTNGELASKVVEAAMNAEPSIDFTGYWQRRAAA